jgi:hypothetical protein
MSQRTVKDSGGRVWTCDAVVAPLAPGETARPAGLDVKLSCSSPSVPAPVSVTVGWGWEKMAEPGLARMIALASPLPKS